MCLHCGVIAPPHHGERLTLIGSKHLLQTCGRSPSKDWKQPPLETILSLMQDPTYIKGKNTCSLRAVATSGECSVLNKPAFCFHFGRWSLILYCVSAKSQDTTPAFLADRLCYRRGTRSSPPGEFTAFVASRKKLLFVWREALPHFSRLLAANATLINDPNWA